MIVGILGAGQLARMLILNSKHLGIDFLVYAPEITATTQDLAEHIVADFDDHEALAAFCQRVDVVTYESENIELATVEVISEHRQLLPGRKVLASSQDRLLEKQLFHHLDIPTNNYRTVDNIDNVRSAIAELGLPLVLKARRLGYDGKHQFRIHSDADLALLADVDLDGFIAEAYVDFTHEVSIIGVRNQQGEITCYDLCHNIHQEGILSSTKNIAEDPLFPQAQQYLTAIMQDSDYVGVLTVEFFVADGQLLANEMAPRVHNSGHWTIEGAYCSQFENHIRAITALPLGSTQSLFTCRMDNCIGAMPKRTEIMAEGGYYHDYQKQPRPKRKLGHITYLNVTH